MFEFTTLCVYNAIETTGANKNMYVASNSKTPSLRIGNTRFEAANIESVLIKNPTIEQLASVTFDMADIALPDDGEINELTGRIVLYVGLSMNSQDSFYANDFVYKGKPFYIEFSVKKGEGPDAIAKKVAKIAKKYMLFTADEDILTITTDTTAADALNAVEASGSVTFTAKNGYQLIKKAALQKYDPSAFKVDCCSEVGEYIDVTVGVPVVYTTDATGAVTSTNYKLGEDGEQEALGANEVAIEPGLEAFGDYNWIIHNLRLPTEENTDFWTGNKGEMPVVGQTYTQFCITMCVERDRIAGEMVGQRGKSVTNHILYVAGLASTSGTPAYKVKSALTTLLGADAATKIKTDADTKLQAPFGE